MRILKAGIMLSAISMLLVACSSTPPRWMKFGYSHQEFETDWAQCKDQQSPEQCMRDKGYSPDYQ